MKKIEGKHMVLMLIVLFLGIFPFLVKQSDYWLTFMVMMGIYALVAVALNIMIGYGGLISIGHAGFLMIGTYTVAILTDKFNLPFLLIFLLSGLMAALVGLLIALSALKLSGHFLAVVTLGFGLSVPVIAMNWNSLTKGYSGMLVAKPALLENKLYLYYFIILSLLIFLTFIYNILKSNIGRVFNAIKESEIAARSSGINTTYYKGLMFVLSSFFTGIAGGLYAYWIGFVGPTDFPITTSFLLLAMIVVGGMNSFYGPILGAVLFSMIPHFTDKFTGITNIVIGLTLVLVILIRPNGLVTIFDRFRLKVPTKKVENKLERSA